MTKDNKLKPSEFNSFNNANIATKCQFNGNNGFNLAPRCVIVIAGTPCIPSHFSLVRNNDVQSNALTIKFQSDLIDITSLYREMNLIGKAFVVELWVGYLDTTKQTAWTQDLEYADFLSNDELKNELLDTYQDKLYRSYIGIIKQFELSYSEDGDYTTLLCGDFALVLQEHDYESIFKDEQSSVENVVKDINKALTSFSIEFSKDVKDEKKVLMGYEKKIKRDKDSGDETEESKEVKYTTEGKTYWNIIEEICKKANLLIDVDLQDYDFKKQKKIKYILRPRLTSNVTWLLERERHFDTCNLRSGKIGVGTTNNVQIEVRSLNDETSEYESGSFPENLSKADNPNGSRFFIYITEHNKSKSELDLKAKDIALQHAKFAINGDLSISHAIIGMNAGHNLIIIDNSTSLKGRSLNVLAGDFNKFDDESKQDSINFTIKNIAEDYEFGEAYSQKIEFEMNQNLNIVDVATGELKGMNLFPRTKYEESTTNSSVSYYDNLRPKIESLPSPLRKIREAGGI